MKLNLSSTAWEDLTNYLVFRGAIPDTNAALNGFTSVGYPGPCIAFMVPRRVTGGPHVHALMRLAAALADAFTSDVDALVELAADGYGVQDFLADVHSDEGRGWCFIFFPGHKAQSL